MAFATEECFVEWLFDQAHIGRKLFLSHIDGKMFERNQTNPLKRFSHVSSIITVFQLFVYIILGEKCTTEYIHKILDMPIERKEKLAIIFLLLLHCAIYIGSSISTNNRLGDALKRIISPKVFLTFFSSHRFNQEIGLNIENAFILLFYPFEIMNKRLLSTRFSNETTIYLLLLFIRDILINRSIFNVVNNVYYDDSDK